jgi:hypothetical protein
MQLLGLALCLAAVASAQAYHDKLDGDWAARWVHSEDPKYAGKFVLEAPKGLADKALKVRAKAIRAVITA